MWILLIIITTFIIWLSKNNRYKHLYIALKTLPRDLRITVVYFKIFNTARILYRDKLSLNTAFTSLARKHPEKVALYFEDEKWTYSQVEELSNKIGRYFQSEGYVKGDVIALFMENCPEYPCIFLGLSKIGITTALINSNLVKHSLTHSITVVKPKGLIFGGSCKQFIEEISGDISNIKFYQFNTLRSNSGRITGSIDLDGELEKTSNLPPENCYIADPKDAVVYIYTSGTTGLPKASILTHLRFLLGAKTFEMIGNITPNDVIYTPLPLYHTVGAMLGLGQALVTGTPVVLRKKFSATNYFLDCEKYNVTVCQYIGEMCRYILLSGSEQKVPKHKIRVMIGNGLKPKIWKSFMEKFDIKHIIEGYGATEGVSNFINMDNKIGSIGYIPWFLRPIYSVKLLKCDTNGEILKNSTGGYIVCKAGENGVAIGKIDLSKAVLHFDGYTDKAATEKKILRDVFKKGDMFYNSGDILTYDDLGYYYFVDRTGDTFRWKSENVSTSEVETIISNLVDLADVVVYGVQVPQTEGRAGMAAIVDQDNSVEIESLGEILKNNLPSYAVPIFIRILDSIPITGTFKLKKFELRNEGYDLNKIQDRIYFLDNRLGKYVTFTKELYEKIVEGSLRL